MIRALIALTAFTAAAQEVRVYDLLLKGGHVIDLKNKRNERLDIGIAGGKIVRIAKTIPAAYGRRIVDVSDYYVTPGLIDINAHFDDAGSPMSLNPDHNALRNGVTTAVDAGSTTPATFEAFKKNVAAHSTTRLLAFLDPGSASPESVAQLIQKYPETIVGLKAGPANLDSALKAAGLARTIVLADVKSAAAHRPGDILTHIYSRQAPQIDAQTRRKGVLLDVGHGSEGFWFRVAAPAIKQGLLPDTISTDLDKSSVMLPRATMTNVMSKLLALGLTVEQVIERATVNPAKAIRRPELGALDEGTPADIAVLELRKGPVGLLDAGHAKLTTDRELRCVLTVRNGKVVWDSEGLSLTNWRDAGPYSNFK